MPYCITLRSRTDTRIITGWYTGCACRWSTDQMRKKLFDNRREAKPACDQLRSLCPRNAEVINIEEAQDDPSFEMIPPMSAAFAVFPGKNSEPVAESRGIPRHFPIASDKITARNSKQ